MSVSSKQSLVEAIRSGDLEAVRDLLEAEPRLASERPEGAPSFPLLAAYYRQPAIANLLVNRGAPVSIFEAAALGRTEDAKTLVTSDPNLVDAYNDDGFQPLGLACFFGHPDTARLFVEHGAAVNSPSRNSQRVTPIHSAVAAGDVESVRLLIAAGAAVSAVQEGGFTPLHQAAQAGQVEILRLLLDAGASPATKADDGSTPLDLAQRGGHAEVVRLLA